MDSFKPLTGRDDSSRREDFIKNLISYRDWIDKNIIYLRGEIEDGDNEDSDSFGLKYAFRTSQTPQAAPDMKMLQLQSMLYVSSGEKQEWILEAYKACKSENDKPSELTFNMLRQKALEWWGSKRQINELTYSSGMNRLAFWMLDYLLWEKICNENSQQYPVSIRFSEGVELQLSKHQIDAIKNYRFTQNRSVEHLHPQKPSNESEQWQQDRQNNDDRIRNSFGNLCMISQSTNSSLSNEPVDVKFAKVRFALQGHPLQSIKLMLMFAQCNGNDSEWNPEKAMIHGRDMLKILGFKDEEIRAWENNLNAD